MLIYADTPKHIYEGKWSGVVHLGISRIIGEKVGGQSALDLTEFVLNNGMVNIQFRAASVVEKEAWLREIGKRVDQNDSADYYEGSEMGSTVALSNAENFHGELN